MLNWEDHGTDYPADYEPEQPVISSGCDLLFSAVMAALLLMTIAAVLS